MTFTEDWYSAGQCEKVAELAKSVSKVDGSFIEIGCWEGKSSSHIARAINPKTLLCVDTWRGNINEDPNHPSVRFALARNVYQQFIANMEADDINYIVFIGDWRDFFEGNLLNIAFLHIDAEHDYQSVYDCLVATYRCMVPGSLMCGDDFMTANMTRKDLNGGVERAVREFFEPKGLLPQNYNNLWWVEIP